MLKIIQFLGLAFLLSMSSSILAQENRSIQKVFYEKVYLHTDRDLYTAGEDIWYKAYLVNAQSSQLSNTSNNLYVELITPSAEIVDREVIKLKNGIGIGDFKISDSVTTGTYRIRAYTNWMGNFGGISFLKRM